jgi:hypothetical protein
MSRPVALVRPLALVVVVLIGACGGGGDGPTVEAGSPTSAERAATTATAEPPAPTTTQPAEPFYDIATSVTQGEHEVFDVPGGEVLTRLPNPWVGDSPLVFLVKDASDPFWYEVYLPIRPNGSTGYVRAEDVELARHNWHIEVRLSEFRLIARDGDEVFLDTQVAVAADNTPTPGGLYYTTELRGPFEPSNGYGTYAYGLSGYSEVLESFNGGDGQLGIHGTNQPELIGTEVSHGCIRLRNEDIERLVPVLPLGVPVEVIP